jgi:hypothetical protein
MPFYRLGGDEVTKGAVDVGWQADVMPTAGGG